MDELNWIGCAATTHTIFKQTLNRKKATKWKETQQESRQKIKWMNGRITLCIVTVLNYAHENECLQCLKIISGWRDEGML